MGATGKIVSSACYDMQQVCDTVYICNRSPARRVNNGELTIFTEYPIWCPRSRGISFLVAQHLLTRN